MSHLPAALTLASLLLAASCSLATTRAEHSTLDAMFMLVRADDSEAVRKIEALLAGIMGVEPSWFVYNTRSRTVTLSGGHVVDSVSSTSVHGRTQSITFRVSPSPCYSISRFVELTGASRTAELDSDVPAYAVVGRNRYSRGAPSSSNSECLTYFSVTLR